MRSCSRSVNPRFRLVALLVLASSLLVACPQQPTTVASKANPISDDAPLASSIAVASSCARITRIDVWKADRRLRATCDDGSEFDVDVAIGRGDGAAKEASGDRRTPEGRYAVVGPARPSRFHLFIPIDYPSVSDAERGLSEGLVDASIHSRILEAHAAGRLPPQDTALGGAIGLHGEGERWQGETQRTDWTLGCVAVSDAEIERLAERVRVGVPVWIHP